MIVLRVKKLLQLVESRVPTKCVPEELTESIILKREYVGKIMGGSDTWLRSINSRQGERV